MGKIDANILVDNHNLAREGNLQGKIEDDQTTLVSSHIETLLAPNLLPSALDF